MTNRHQSPWTPESIAKLKELWMSEGKFSAGAIARQLNTSKNSVVGKAHRLGLAARPSPIKPAGPNGTQTKIRREQSLAVREVVKAAPVVEQAVKYSPFRTCQFIHGKERTEYRFCGEVVASGTAWCPEHYRRVYLSAVKAEAEKLRDMVAAI
jgi:GcrA cell cycle regulator